MKLTNCIALPVVALVFAFFACKPKESPSASALTAVQRNFSKRECFKPDQCAEINLNYPEFSGGNAAVATALNDTVRHFLLAVTGGNSKLPFAAALDSVGTDFVAGFLSEKKEAPDFPGGWQIETNGKVLLQNTRILSLEMNEYSFTGGAHPNGSTLLFTFDLNTGKCLNVNDFIKDTTLILPLLEQAFKADKGLQPTDSLADLLFSPGGVLPLPASVCVVPEGVRFLYNPYEVAAYAVGMTDIVLTWDQLGALADKSKVL